MKNELTKMKWDLKNIECISFELVASISPFTRSNIKIRLNFKVIEIDIHDEMNRYTPCIID